MPKLPADLPENWTRGQIVSPNGTETGLTEQHGYNYLMKQVNDTQTEVNNINDALPDVAQQATVDEINNKIGTESDADTQPTLFGRLAQVKNVLVEKLTEVITKITGIDSKIGTSSDTSEDETLFGQIKAIVDTLAGKKYVYSDTVQKTYNNISLTTDGNNQIKKSIIIASFDAEYDGTLRFTANISINKENDSFFNYVTFYAISSSTWIPNGFMGLASIEDVLGKPEGTEYPYVYGRKVETDGNEFIVPSGNYSKTFYRFSGAKATEPFSMLLHCKKGDKIAFVVDINMYYNTTLKVQDIKLKYDVK